MSSQRAVNSNIETITVIKPYSTCRFANESSKGEAHRHIVVRVIHVELAHGLIPAGEEDEVAVVTDVSWKGKQENTRKHIVPERAKKTTTPYVSLPMKTIVLEAKPACRHETQCTLKQTHTQRFTFHTQPSARAHNLKSRAPYLDLRQGLLLVLRHEYKCAIRYFVNDVEDEVVAVAASALVAIVHLQPRVEDAGVGGRGCEQIIIVHVKKQAR